MRPLPGILALLCLVASVGLLAADLELEVAPSSAPAEVSLAIRETLASEALRVVSGAKPQAEFWMRQDIPAQENGSAAAMGATFGSFSESLLVGVVRFPSDWSDYRERPIPAGVYTLRYALQPEDGNHLGASIYRDYLVLVPAAADSDPDAGYSFGQLTELSRQASRTNHPAILSLFPIYDEVATPALVKNEIDQWTLAVSVHSVLLGMVVQGHGEE